MSLEKALETVYTEEPSELHTAITEMMIDGLRQKIKDKVEVRRILDVGCGMGVAWPFFEKAWPECTINVVTPDGKEQENANKELKAIVARVIDQIPITVMPYDLIWARHSMEHTISPFSDLVRLRHFLNDDGYLYIEVPSPDTVCGHEYNKNHYSVLTDKMWQSLFRKAGYVVDLSGDLDIDLEIGKDKYFWYILQK